MTIDKYFTATVVDNVLNDLLLFAEKSLLRRTALNGLLTVTEYQIMVADHRNIIIICVFCDDWVLYQFIQTPLTSTFANWNYTTQIRKITIHINFK